MLQHLFFLCNVAVLPGWLLLIVAPRWRGTATITSCLLPLLLGLVYVALIAVNLPAASGGFTRLEDVAQLFSQPGVLLAGWIHYLAFDLFIGGWQVRDARRFGVPHGLVIPCLVLTLMLGPTGLVSYFMLRATHQQFFANNDVRLT